MATPDRPRKATAADLVSLGEEVRAEIIHGAIVEKAAPTMEHAHETYRHDSVGWRRDRVPDCPRGRPIRVRPDWVCELLSPSNEKTDRVDKFQVLYACGVPHYCIANPQDRTLVVHRWTESGYLIVLTAASGQSVRAEPFEAVELRVGVLFGDEEDDE